MSIKDVHTEHCCDIHGCKYSNEYECTVLLGKAQQSYPCEYCDMEEQHHARIREKHWYVKYGDRLARRTAQTITFDE